MYFKDYSIKRTLLDWKFSLMLVVTVVGIAIPVWISRSEMQTKSLQMRIVSQTMLQPGSTKTVSGLKILVDSIELEHPVLSVLELANNGSMSILPSEFEASLKIMVGADAQIVRAENTSVNPENLAPKITRNTEQDFVLAPLLLNPGDTMTFAVLTAKKDPVFSVNARIVGIRNVTIENGLAHEQSYKKSLFQLFTAFFLLVTYISLAVNFRFNNRCELSMTTQLVALISSLSGFALLVVPIMRASGLSASWSLGILVGFSVVASVLAYIFTRPKITY